MPLKIGFLKPAAAVTLGAVLLGFFLFGQDFFSYLRTSARAVQEAARDQVSVEFELQRARDLVDEILPKMQANVRQIAQEEVEIAALESDIAGSHERLNDRKDDLARLRQQLATQQVAYRVGKREFSREQLAQQLSQQFDRYREDELILRSKEELLSTRRKSLQAAMQTLDLAKHQKLQLQQKIEHLIAKHRLVQANASLADQPIEGVDLSRAEKLIADIQTRIDVSQRILEHSGALRPIDLGEPEIDAADVLAEFDDYFDQDAPQVAAVDHE